MDNLSDFSAKETDGICFMQDILGGTGYSDTEAFDKKELKKNVDTERNLTWHSMDITKDVRAKQLGQQPKTIWLTGLSGSGKSTIVNELEKRLFIYGKKTMVLDGDNVRTQKAISQLFDVDRSVITKHLSNIFKEGELDENSVCAKFAQTADDGKTYNYKFYSLAAIIAVGYRINSERATQFRTWATKVLDTFTKQGYVLDKSRLINGQIFDEDYFEHLIAEIQEIRASERRFYQKITDIYATAVDYDKNSQVTREFYATVQNKMHYAVHGNTAAEVIVARADHNKEHMGLKSWKNAPDGKIVKTDVSIAKNYLEKEELAELNEIVTMYLDYATRQARRHIPMTMEDWKTKLDAFLRFNDADVLQDKGKVTAAIAKEFAESEFEKYRVIQDSLYESDFDKLMNDMEKNDS